MHFKAFAIDVNHPVYGHTQFQTPTMMLRLLLVNSLSGRYKHAFQNIRNQRQSPQHLKGDSQYTERAVLGGSSTHRHRLLSS